MKLHTAFIFTLIIFLSGSSFRQSERVEFICMKTHKASNTCHFNFKVDGSRYRYVDAGCKMSGKKEEVIRKAKDGRLGLAREWKVACPETQN